MSRIHSLLQAALPFAVLAALAPISLVSSEAEACDGCTAHAQAQAPIESTQLLVVKFHADWCGSCVKLDTPLEALQSEFSGKPVDFVRLDLTDETTQAAAKSRAERLGLSELFTQYGNKTGFALVIDASTGQVVGELRASQDLDAMRNLLSSSLGKVAA
jgi:thiol-disulfide isomerase/thioredoxin